MSASPHGHVNNDRTGRVTPAVVVMDEPVGITRQRSISVGLDVVPTPAMWATLSHSAPVIRGRASAHEA